MAEFCRDCFYRMVGNRNDRVIMSNEPDFCEGCGEVKPVVLYVYSLKDNAQAGTSSKNGGGHDG